MKQATLEQVQEEVLSDGEDDDGDKMRIKKVHVILLYHLKQLEFEFVSQSNKK